MADRFSPSVRHEIMSRVRGSDTTPELRVRSFLHRLGYRFRLHSKNLPGRPDIVLPRYRAVIFVHGCFWHQHPGCAKARLPETNKDKWSAKLSRNVERDRENVATLREAGWGVAMVWECDLNNRQAIVSSLAEVIIDLNRRAAENAISL
jgi:DNA mismatch endonuclease, patch repair protein